MILPHSMFVQIIKLFSHIFQIQPVGAVKVPMAPSRREAKRPILYLSSSIVSLASNASDGQMTRFTPLAAIKSEQGFWI